MVDDRCKATGNPAETQRSVPAPRSRPPLKLVWSNDRKLATGEAIPDRFRFDLYPK
jgi:hypothetical protein